MEPVPRLGRICAELSSPAIHWTHSLPVRTRLPAAPIPWSGEPSDVPSVDYWFRESERVWDAAHHQLQRAVRRSKMTADLRRAETPSLPAWSEGLAVHSGHQDAPALQEAQSQIRWPLHHHQADKPSHIPASASLTV